MPIEITCTGCGRTLRVSDADVGKQARCPACNTISQIGAPAAHDAATRKVGADPPPVDDWYFAIPEGQVYGPIRKFELDQWVREGRVSADCRVRVGSNGVWTSAVDHYPEIARTLPPAPAPRRPHRGALILVLGVLSWFACPVFGVAAWIMGANDLAAMREGQMDRSDSGITYAGVLIGAIHVVLIFLVLVGILLFAMFLA